MFHTGRNCAACQPVLFPTVKIESSLGKRQAREICWESAGIYATFQDNFSTIGKDNRDDSRDD